MKFKLFFFILLTYSDSYAQIADSHPSCSEKENYKIFEGGSQLVTVDKESSLENLIQTLNNNWELEITGKAYWIGYPDFMYSIAAHKNTAIQPLLNFINSSTNIHAKEGAIYCLHLIGINSTIIGRFKEKFINKNARGALLHLIFRKELSDLVFHLLARDPWKSDLPILAFYLKYYPTNLTLNNALFRYEKDEMPFRQIVRYKVDNLIIFLKDSFGVHRIGNLKTIWKPNEKYKSLGQGLIFETIRLFYAEEPALPLLKSYFDCSSEQALTGTCQSTNRMFKKFMDLSEEKVDIFSYCELKDNLHHYILKDRILVICTPDQTHARWLKYFEAKFMANKKQLE